MYLICGLGNKGTKYEYNRHNIGFLFIDFLCRFFSHDPNIFTEKFKAKLYNFNLNKQKIILAKPQTYMNRSGESISEIANFYKIPNKNIIIIHDDLDLKFGIIKNKFSGSNAGHNGLKDIDSKISNAYHRIRIGIDHPRNLENSKIEVASYVLQDFNDLESANLDNIFLQARDKLFSIIHPAS